MKQESPCFSCGECQKIHVFEIAWLTREQVELFQSDFKIVADYFVQKRENNDYVPSPQKIKHVDAVLNMLKACSGDSRFGDSMVMENQGEREVTNMCEILDRVEARGLAKGKVMIVVNLIRKKHMGIAAISELLEVEEDYVGKIVSLIEEYPEDTDKEIAERYLGK